MDRPSIHDIRLSFTFKHLWSILSVSLSHLIEKKDLKYNFDIKLQDIELTDHVIKTTIHKTDIVSVIVACILNPIPVDMFGLVKLSSSLARVEDRLQILVDEYNSTSIQSGRQQYMSLKLNSKISNHMSWTVKMWHFGQDVLTSYSGDKFEITWEDSLNLFRIYSKEYVNKKMKVRNEVQECPNKPLEEAFMDKLKDDNENTFVVGV